MSRYLTAALYKFVDLPDFATLREPLLAACEGHQVKGTLLLACEGINGTIAGPEAGVRAVLAHLRADPRLATLQHKEAWASRPPFLRMKVRLKKEIVTLQVPGLDPNKTVGQYVKPQAWDALLADPDLLLIDTRNDYEVAIGTFKGAINPSIKTFTELPAWLDAQPALQGDKKPRVAMFCTGGIRCEKSTALLKMRGFDEVYHLEGGILKYLEEIPPAQSSWEGECFVFDERVSVGHGLRPGPHELCRSCRWPLADADKASPHYVKGVSCPHCHDQRTPEEKAGLAERQRQVELAEARGEVHVGARMPEHEPPH
ncbi:rhodanese-related sulfurtransferase [Hydrogenophaga taeniospiralis]|uniref:oxygen-dependent tRNA uridine(34) hydroxylase TrhO n=1 Tax=Hydrogenophaga taeniospiralis TaxID=65656 RepID=UPI001CF9C4D3|nr:rhodanese-related sulfurtransferase [Hydrogenophaga taeniospiralis]MCB4364396.1 rhodanese-related sulfurtransferase [Hydrogenophaga taeniospiralis]